MTCNYKVQKRKEGKLVLETPSGLVIMCVDHQREKHSLFKKDHVRESTQG
ncbi:hypothetical protein MPNT_460010 [Candidatus Methylacidithermus pantelleriae]|uniref:Uncharacterized protein n=1 Tax=Candidatus Methylacidithermus pantelleriae TaxID=2744239 RepID=A0A8J2FPD8_9BACT|nr:hypothetical protein MPNT_460010 [Candidatus Methylacidithermus pantelleriae]